MCDSITILVLLADQSQAEYDRCQYPTRGKEDLDEVSSDFRDQYAISPLTGARFKITPVGAETFPSRDEVAVRPRRKVFGRLDGYVVDFNPPACTVGHNRLLVNGVPAAIDVGLALLKHWLAENGCTREGLDAANSEAVDIISVTPTFLFNHADESDARLALAQIRGRSEALCNTKNKEKEKEKETTKTKTKAKGSTTKPPAFSVPPEPPKHGEYIYTSYIKLREYLIDCYVKKFGANKAFYLPISDSAAEFVVDQLSKRTLRIGTKLHGKWLKDHGLNKAANWLGSNKAYEKAFALVRSTLRLDEELRSKQIRSKTVSALNLPKSDLTLLRYHLDRNKAREHPMFSALSTKQVSKAYSASRLRIMESTKIDLEVDYDDQLKNLFPSLSELLVFPGKYKPSERIAAFVFSPISVPIILEKLAQLTDDMLHNRAVTVPKGEIKNLSATSKRRFNPVVPAGEIPNVVRHSRGISAVPVDPNAMD